MRYQEYKTIIRSEERPKPDPTLRIGALKGICTVDGLYPLPVICASSSIPRAAAIDVADEQQQPIGILLTCRDEEFTVGKFGTAHLAAYLLEISPDQYSQPGRFSTDYVLIKRERLKEYRDNFMASSAIWGGFWHSEQSSAGVMAPAPAPQPITARSEIRMPTSLHAEAAKRSAMLPYAFERYLKLYHLLELSFDHDTVVRIRALGDDLHGIGQILSQHKSNELVRLKQLILDKCSDRGAVARCIEDLCRERKWDVTARDIFFTFGKDGNPLANRRTQFENMVTGPGFNQAGAVSSDVISAKQAGQGEFEELVLETSAYWIYRVRSSIAHNRIGEYVMKPHDEEFGSSSPRNS